MFSRSVRSSFKVAVLGAAGGIGQPLSLLLKQNSKVSRLALYDVANAIGVATDLSHINTRAQVHGYARDDINKALVGSDVIIIPAGVPRKPGMTRDDLFNVNASIVKNLTTAIATAAPKAHILIISNPVNSTVPIAAAILEKAKVYDPRRLYGVTTLDVVRANTFVAETLVREVHNTNVTVVGGHSGPTIVPLLSQTGLKFTPEQLEKLTFRIQYGGDEVVKAKDGTGSATLSMAYAAARFANSVFEGLEGKLVKECAFVDTNTVDPRVTFFSSTVTFGSEGWTSVAPIGEVSDYEKGLLEKCVTELQANIKKGVDFAKA